MQQQNPELIEQLRSQMRSRPPSSAGNDEPWHTPWYHTSQNSNSLLYTVSVYQYLFRT